MDLSITETSCSTIFEQQYQCDVTDGGDGINGKIIVQGGSPQITSKTKGDRLWQKVKENG